MIGPGAASMQPIWCPTGGNTPDPDALYPCSQRNYERQLTMTRKTSSRSIACLGSAAAIMLLSGSVFAQDGPRRGPSDALRGPSVNDRAMPRDERFGDSMMEGRRRDAGMANYRLLVASVTDLVDHENERVRLTEEQRMKIREIQGAYQTALREYMVEAREQSRNLRERVQRAIEEAGDDREAVEQIRDRARERAQQIRENAPNSARAEAAIWEVLTQPQQRIVKAQIEQRTDDMMRDRQMERERSRRGADAQRPTDRRPDARDRRDTDMGPGAGVDRPRGPQADRPGERQTDRVDPGMRRWAQLFQRIQRLTPEQQDRLFNMINSTLDRVDAPREGDRSAPRPGADRPRRPAPDAQRGSDRPSDTRPERPGRGGPRA